MKFLRLLLFPVSLVYALVVFVRNLLFDLGIYRSRRFPIPVISVGNLAVGGAGKSPVTEYIVRLLIHEHKLATLSRGYGRKTKGFLLAQPSSGAAEIGDEPAQFKGKFPEITVAVCEDRAQGIDNLIETGHEAVVMDDAFQHRSVTPGLSILLFDYNQVFKRQWYLPTGNLRESLSGRKRADAIVISKCPANLTDSEKKRLAARVKPFHGQKLFFSFLEYSRLQPLFSGAARSLQTINSATQVILLTGIAFPGPLLNELRKHTSLIIHQEYPDHHIFSRKNITKLADAYFSSETADRLIVTTEKDAQRLRDAGGNELLKDLPVYYLPISARFHEPEGFDTLIKTYVAEH